MRPGLVIDPSGELDEEDEILRAELELPRRAAEVKALVLAALARGVLAHVAAMLRAGRDGTEPHGIARLGPKLPEQGVPPLDARGWHGEPRGAHCLSEDAQRLLRRAADGHREIDRAEHGRIHL